MSLDELRLFALHAGQPLGGRIADALQIALSPHEERDFADGEHKSWPLTNVRGRDVFVVQSLHADATQSVNDKLCRLLFFAGALRDAGADRITVVVPYLCYARADRKVDPRGPVITLYVAQLLEAVGVDGVLTLDVHSLTAYQNAFRCRNEHLEARRLFVDHFAPWMGGHEATVVSPDAGGMKRAEGFRERLATVLGRPVTTAYVEKHRAAAGVTGKLLVGNVRGHAAIIVDDMVTTGTTLARAATACHEAGAERVYAAVTHGLFVGDAAGLLEAAPLEAIAITDTVPFRLERHPLAARVQVVTAAPLIGAAIRRIHTGGSLVELME